MDTWADLGLSMSGTKNFILTSDNAKATYGMYLPPLPPSTIQKIARIATIIIADHF
jgi:uncharacterized protein YpbB